MAHKLSLTPNKRFKQGTFIPKNPTKYIGSLVELFYRSSWERRCMVWFDENTAIIGWNSEGLKIQYLYPVDSKWHTYHVDFLVKMKTKSGEIKTYAIEVKPYKETLPPRKSKNQARLLLETQTYIKNQCKWEAAKEFCSKQGVQFIVLTEKDLNI